MLFELEVRLLRENGEVIVPAERSCIHTTNRRAVEDIRACFGVGIRNHCIANVVEVRIVIPAIEDQIPV